MKHLVLCLGAVLLAAGLLIHFPMRNKPLTAHLNQEISPVVRDTFEKWAAVQGKVYSSPSEKAHRLRIFYQTYLDVQAHNSNPQRSYNKGFTKFADIDDEEFSGVMRTASTDSHSRTNKGKNSQTQNLQAMTVPESVDWSFSKMVGQVRDIGNCGGCYAIAAVEAMEVAYFQEKGSYVQFSAQEILECSNTPPFNNNGCNGGAIMDSFLYIQRRGIASEANYPYTGKLQRCQSSVPRFIPQDKVDFFEVPVGDSDTLKSLVAQRPVSTKMNFDGLKNYSSGIYNGEKCANIATHYVTIVGYDTTIMSQKKVHYWIIKNNVGSSFGENGYLRVVRALGPNPSVCGITEYAIYPYFSSKL